MTKKVLYRDDFNAEEILVIQNYLIAELQKRFPIPFKESGYWYHQSKYSDHFSINISEKPLREKVMQESIEIFGRKGCSDLAKYFNLTFLYDDFNADLIFEVKDKIDLTCIYGLARIIKN